MSPTRRTVLASVCTLAFATAGCALTPDHGSEILVRNERANGVTVMLEGRNLETGEVTLDQTLDLEPTETEYVLDPSQTGEETQHQITATTESGASESRQWAPANPGQQLKVLINSDGISLDVGAIE